MSQILHESAESKSGNIISKNMTGFFADKKNRVIAILMAIAVGAVFTAIIIENELGLNVFLLTGLMCAFAGYALHRDDNLDSKKYMFWSIVLLALASVFFRLQSQIYTVFAALFIPPTYVLLTMLSAKKVPSNIIVSGVIRFFGSIAFVDKIFIAIKSLLDENGGKGKAQSLKIVIGLAVSIVLLLMIVPLMFSADVVFKNFVVELVDLTRLAKVLWKTVLSAFITILFFGFLYIITVKKEIPEMERKTLRKEYGAEMALIIVLSVVGAVYSVFAILQFSYLFGGTSSQLPDGYTLTEYARSGYFEQVAMTVINLGIIAAALFLTDSSKGGLKKAINGLLTYFIAVNIYLMVSSAYKMYLYQDMYGFTVLRLLVDILLIFEACVFAFVAIKIFKRQMKYLTYLLYFTAAFWAVVSFVNVEGMSANLNIGRYEDGKEIDIVYMTRLDDVSSQLLYIYENYENNLNEEEKANIKRYFFRGKNEEELQEYYDYNIFEFNMTRSEKETGANRLLEMIEGS